MHKNKTLESTVNRNEISENQGFCAKLSFTSVLFLFIEYIHDILLNKSSDTM